MSSNATSPAETKSPLDAAQRIVAELQGMDVENQSLALHFVMQTLRLTSPTTHAAEPRAPSHTLAPLASPTIVTPVTDIKSFTAIKAPKSDQQFTAVVAYFYQIEAKQVERKDVIDADTVKEAARLAGWPQVKRWAMTLTNAKNAGYLDPAGDGKFKLSSVGENLVAITLPGDGSAGGTSGGGTGRKGIKRKPNPKKKASKRG